MAHQSPQLRLQHRRRHRPAVGPSDQRHHLCCHSASPDSCFATAHLCHLLAVGVAPKCSQCCHRALVSNRRPHNRHCQTLHMSHPGHRLHAASPTHLPPSPLLPHHSDRQLATPYRRIPP